MLDTNGFPRSRNIKQLIFYLKYFILVKEWFKESQTDIPEHIEETIYLLGQGYAFAWQNIGSDFLFNGNNNSDNKEFDNYLKRLGYKFKNENFDFGGYAILRNKKISLIMDIGSTPNFKYTKEYQSGALSFEIITNGKIMSIDIKEMEPIENVKFYKGDILEKETKIQVKNYFNTYLDVILSDMAADTTGIKSLDSIRTNQLCANVIIFAKTALKPQGVLVSKLFMGEGFIELKNLAKSTFKNVNFFKPESSRKESKETYLHCEILKTL